MALMTRTTSVASKPNPIREVRKASSTAKKQKPYRFLHANREIAAFLAREKAGLAGRENQAGRSQSQSALNQGSAGPTAITTRARLEHMRARVMQKSKTHVGASGLRRYADDAEANAHGSEVGTHQELFGTKAALAEVGTASMFGGTAFDETAFDGNNTRGEEATAIGATLSSATSALVGASASTLKLNLASLGALNAQVATGNKTGVFQLPADSSLFGGKDNSEQALELARPVTEGTASTQAPDSPAGIGSHPSTPSTSAASGSAGAAASAGATETAVAAGTSTKVNSASADHNTDTAAVVQPDNKSSGGSSKDSPRTAHRKLGVKKASGKAAVRRTQGLSLWDQQRQHKLLGNRARNGGFADPFDRSTWAPRMNGTARAGTGRRGRHNDKKKLMARPKRRPTKLEAKLYEQRQKEVLDHELSLLWDATGVVVETDRAQNRDNCLKLTRPAPEDPREAAMMNGELGADEEDEDAMYVDDNRPTKMDKNSGKQQRHDLVTEDCNFQNYLLRFVFYKCAPGKQLIWDLEEEDLPQTWFLCDQGKETKNSDFPQQMQFSGHVKTALRMDKLLRKVLEQQRKKGVVQHYQVLDGYRPQDAVLVTEQGTSSDADASKKARASTTEDKAGGDVHEAVKVKVEQQENK